MKNTNVSHIYDICDYTFRPFDKVQKYTCNCGQGVNDILQSYLELRKE